MSNTTPDGNTQRTEQVKFPKPAAPAGTATLPPGAVPLPMPPNAVTSVPIGNVVEPVTLPPGVVREMKSGAEIKYFAVPPGTVKQIAVSDIPGYVKGPVPVGRARARWPYVGGSGVVVAAALMAWAVRRRRSVEN